MSGSVESATAGVKMADHPPPGRASEKQSEKNKRAVQGTALKRTAPPVQGSRTDPLRVLRGEVLDMLEEAGWLVNSGPDALFFADGFEALVMAHFSHNKGE